eukprot:g1867.t1
MMSVGLLFIVFIVLSYSVKLEGSCTSNGNRSVRFWVGAGGAGGVPIIDRSSNASCTDFFIGNLTKYNTSVDSLGFEVWSLTTRDGGIPTAQFNDGSSQDHGLAACVAQIKKMFPHINIGIAGTVDSVGSLSASARDPTSYVSALRNFTDGIGFSVDEIWTDFEISDLSSSEIDGANKMHELTNNVWPTYRYAGCEYRDPPYFGENCSSFVEGAPGVMVQAANTYWSTAISGGWYGGFEKLLDEEIRNIGGLKNAPFLSPALCPDCATGDDANNNLTQEELYARMDIICSRGVSDISMFTFFEVAQLHENFQNDRYMEALRYFRTGTIDGAVY